MVAPQLKNFEGLISTEYVSVSKTIYSGFTNKSLVKLKEENLKLF